MIYLIEIDYTDPASEPEWDAWYDTYLADLVTVPGIETAQRFVAVSSGARRYLAAYFIRDLSAYGTPRYKAIGGGGSASAKWRAHIKRRRNLYEGGAPLPAVSDGERLVLCERDPAGLAAESSFVGLEIRDMRAEQADPKSPFHGQVPFENDPPRRWLAVLSAEAADPLIGVAGVFVYRPSSPRLTGLAA